MERIETDQTPTLRDFASFGPATSIATTDGALPMEWLAVGDKVITRDNGVQPVRWILRQRISFADLVADPRNWPVTIPENAHAKEAPDWPLVISQNHYLLVDGVQLEYLFGQNEALAPAGHLADPSQCHAPHEDQTFYHLLFDDHQLILANGIWAESLFASDALRIAAGPDMPCEVFHTHTTRPCLRKWEANLLRDLIKAPAHQRRKAA